MYNVFLGRPIVESSTNWKNLNKLTNFELCEAQPDLNGALFICCRSQSGGNK